MFLAAGTFEIMITLPPRIVNHVYGNYTGRLDWQIRLERPYSVKDD